MSRFSFSFLLLLLSCWTAAAGPSVKGINILSADREQAERTILLAGADGCNQLQLSHRIVMNLFDLRDTAKLALVRDLAAQAHAVGISEVCVWDHALYDTIILRRFMRPGRGCWTWTSRDSGSGLPTTIGRCSPSVRRWTGWC